MVVVVADSFDLRVLLICSVCVCVGVGRISGIAREIWDLVEKMLILVFIECGNC